VTLPVGTELQASVTGQKQETNSLFASLNPQYNASSSLTVRQPLLQGFGPAGSGKFSEARNSYEAAKHRYQDAIAGVRVTAEGMYWDLYEAERDLAVARLTSHQAAAFMDQVQARANAGLVGPNQLNSAKVFQAEQQFVLLDAEDNLSRTSDALASLIGERVGGASRRYRTADEPVIDATLAPEDSLVAEALRMNHGFLATEWDVEATRAQAKAAWWNALPRLDVFGALGGNGLSGTGRDVIFGSDTLRNDMNTRFSEALDQALKRDYPSWTIGLHAVIPILLREKSGERNRWRAELTRAQQRHERTKRDLEDQVRATYRELLHGRERQEASQVGVEAATNQVRIGMIEYANGRTTAFELVRLGADLANAQRRYSQALVRTAKAEAKLKQLVPEE
jgi:outer membrane protein TolC